MMFVKTLLLGAAGLAAAQFPSTPEGVKILKSKFHENVTISFKEPGLCESSPHVKSYAGHIHLPPGTLDDARGGGKQPYPTNTFFWFFEARHNPEDAPLAIWLNGGPGGSSLMGLLQENGPCFITEDSKLTVPNPWSWNNHVNMLYIDEPNQVGFSYDIPTNVTIYSSGMLPEIVPTDFSKETPELNLTTLAGTISSQNANNTVSSTEEAGHALWHFAQIFFSEFPHYKPHDDRISLWSESYGGHYGPGFMRIFQEQNEKIRNGTIDFEHAHYLHLDTLGIINGYIDAVISEEASISFPFNNTYGIKAFNQSVYDELMHNFTRPGGCRDQIVDCQEKLRSESSTGFPVMTKSKDICDVDDECVDGSERMFQYNNNARFDITHPKEDPFPSVTFRGYLMQESVLQAIGSPVNFSAISGVVSSNFGMLDGVRGGFLDAIGYLLDSGVKVHMMYGDRDFACNWVGGEQSSLAVPYSRSHEFNQAGYTPLQTHDGVGGMTRQFGNYSFTRVFQAGHMVPSYQPAAAYAIFMRALFNKDIATGTEAVHDDLSTVGPSSTWHIKNEAKEAPKPQCYILAPETCTEDVWEKVKAGKVTVKDYFVVEDTGDENGGGEL